MLTSELDFELPARCIAQTPAEPRDSARLLRLMPAMVCGASDDLVGRLEHRHVRDLPALLRAGDLLVFNDTRVLRARLRGRRLSPLDAGSQKARDASGNHDVSGNHDQPSGQTPGARVEALLLRDLGGGVWEAMMRPSARLRPGDRVCFEAKAGAPDLNARLEERRESLWHLRFEVPADVGAAEAVRAWIERHGEVPLPPYIRSPRQKATGENDHSSDDDADASALAQRYQTVFSGPSRPSGAVEPLDSAAAPTAGLHFTPELLDRLRESGIETAFLTLAVGIGTFRPVQSATIEEHTMHEENFWISAECAARVNAARREGRRVIAVGTTSLRALESAARSHRTGHESPDASGDETSMSQVSAGEATTRLFLRPGDRLHSVDALLTNFHLPRSTLLALAALVVQTRAAQAGPSTFLRSSTSSEGQTAKNGENISYVRSESAAGRDPALALLLASYAVAIEKGYRFFSFGDAMLIE